MDSQHIAASVLGWVLMIVPVFFVEVHFRKQESSQRSLDRGNVPR